MKQERDEVRARILDAAREELLLSGYQKASMRTIAAQAGMTVGNIYLYFAGKEQLFDAVVEGPLRMLHTVLQMQEASEENMRALMGTLHDIFICHRVDFLILITRSDGSRYADMKGRIIDMARARMEETIPDARHLSLCGPLAVAVIEGLLYMFVQFDGDEEKLTGDLGAFLSHMLKGMFALSDF